LNSKKKPSVCERDGKKTCQVSDTCKRKLKPRKTDKYFKTQNSDRHQEKKTRGKPKITKWTPPGQGN